MITYEHIGNGGFRVGVQGEYSFSEPICNQVYNDLMFFLNKSKASNIDQVISKRYARASLVFLAFYFESLANLLIDEVGKRFNCSQQLEQIYKKRDHYPKPLRKFQAVYSVLYYGQKLPLDTSGIQDLFLIRNQVIAHPPARSIVAGTGITKGKGLTEKGRSLSLNKFTHFPNIYGEFTSVHTQEVYNETKDFLEKYHNLIARKLSGAAILFYLKKL